MIKILWVVINGLFVFICYIYMGGKYWWWVFVNVMGCVEKYVGAHRDDGDLLTALLATRKRICSSFFLFSWLLVHSEMMELLLRSSLRAVKCVVVVLKSSRNRDACSSVRRSHPRGSCRWRIYALRRMNSSSMTVCGCGMSASDV